MAAKHTCGDGIMKMVVVVVYFRPPIPNTGIEKTVSGFGIPAFLGLYGPPIAVEGKTNNHSLKSQETRSQASRQNTGYSVYSE